MPQTGQHSVKKLAVEIEPHAEAAWPPRETLRLDGWLLRFGEGHSSRLNSVSALNYTGADLARSIEACEVAYRARNLPPLFHISPANDPPELEAALKARGYTAKSDTLLMVADVTHATAPPGTQVFTHATAAFEHLTREGSHSQADGDERLTALARVAHPKALVVSHWAGQAGAKHLYLQVESTNPSAIALYERAGFREAYRYLHYIAP
jgi:hypothetical protein